MNRLQGAILASILSLLSGTAAVAADFEWATVLEHAADPAVVADAATRQKIEAAGLPWRVVDDASGVEFLLVPGGTYLRGAAMNDPFDRENERPQHPVTLSEAFYLGRYEVTNAQMRRFRPAFSSGTFYRDEGISLDAEDHPAVDVSWLDATAFARHFGYRLPTEGEWEWAARAGVRTRYPWGDDLAAGEGWGNVFGLETQARIAAMDWQAFPFRDGFDATAPVGSFRPNAWGFFDMFGNAWEHVADGFDDDAYAGYVGGVTDPYPANGRKRTLRGGGWGNAPRGSGIPYRFGMDAEERHDGNGFRVVKPVSGRQIPAARYRACETCPLEVLEPERYNFLLAEPTWTSPGADAPPTWSADGSEILFQRTRQEGFAQIWAIAPDGGGLRRVTDGTFAAGHPDACAMDDRIVLVSDRDGGAREIYVMRGDGLELERLTTSESDKSWPVFSPDCRDIVYVETRDRTSGHHDLKIVEVATGVTRTLLEAVRYLGWPTWSADGEWVLFHREIAGYPNHIWRVRRAGGEARALTEGDHGDYWSADMSRDGRLLSFAYSARSQLQWGANADLWLMDRATDTCRQIRGEPWHEHGQRLSPNGRQMVYWDNRHGYNEVVVMDLETLSSRQLTFQPSGELTGVAREHGEAAALAHAMAVGGGTVLYSESGMEMLFTTWSRQGHAPALGLAERFRRDFPQSRRALAARARERFRSGDLMRAREDYRQLLVDAPGDSDVISRLGLLAVIEQLTGRNLSSLAREGLPQKDVNGLGYASMRAGALELAIDVFGWNVLNHPSSANAHDSFGEALYWRGEHDVAEDAFRASLRLDAANDNARQFLRRIESAAAKERAIPCPRWSDGPSQRSVPRGTP